MDRRTFLGTLGAAAATAAISSCKNKLSPVLSADTADSTAAATMAYREGKHGERVSLLGYGCMRWPYANEVIDQEEVNRLVDAAMAAGVNYYDTSPAYCQGNSEEATGIALARHPRSSYYVATKLSNFDSSQWSYEASVAMYHRSMEKLQVDYIDFYLLHAVGGGGMENLHNRYLDNGVLDFLLKEREAGRIRNLGFSYHGDIEVFDYLLAENDRYHWDFVQIQLNYVDWHYAREINPRNTNAEYLLGELKKRGIPAVIMEPLLGGRLAKMPKHAVSLLQTAAPDRSIASWAFRYAGQPEADRVGDVLSVLSGMTYMEHLEDNLRSYSPFVPLTSDELAMLEQIAHEYVRYPIVPCTACQYCMPCPYGLDIPGTFFHYNRCLNEGLVEDDQRSPEYRRLRREYLTSYAKEVARPRQADHCVGCGICLSHCPQRIDIPAQMQRIDRYVESLRNFIE